MPTQAARNHRWATTSRAATWLPGWGGGRLTRGLLKRTWKKGGSGHDKFHGPGSRGSRLCASASADSVRVCRRSQGVGAFRTGARRTDASTMLRPVPNAGVDLQGPLAGRGFVQGVFFCFVGECLRGKKLLLGYRTPVNISGMLHCFSCACSRRVGSSLRKQWK